MSPTRRSRTCSSRPSSRPRSTRCWRRAGPGPPASGRSGRPTWPPSKGELPGVIQYETDRARFLGRGRTVRSPAAVIDGRPLSNSVGPVLDPIFSLRLRIRLAPGATAHAIFSTVVAESREEVLDLADKYRDSAAFERAATLAWTQAQVQLHHLGIEQDEAHLFQRLANRILYSDPSLRPPPGLLAQNERGAVRPVAARHLGRPAHRPRPDRRDRGPRHRPAAAPGARVLAAQAARRRPRHRQRARGDLRRSTCRTRIEAVVRTGQSMLVPDAPERRGRVHVLRGDQLSTEDRTLLQTAARAVLLSRRGSLADQVIRLERPEQTRAEAAATAGPRNRPAARSRSHAPSSSSSTAWAASRRTAASTSPCWDRASRRPRRG